MNRIHSSAPNTSSRRVAKITAMSVLAGALTLAVAAPVEAGDPTIDITVELAAAIDDVSSLDAIEAETGMTMTATLLASRGIYEFTGDVEIKVKDADDPKKIAHAVEEAQKDLEKSHHVEWAEPQGDDTVFDDRFHAWPATAAAEADAAQLAGQPAFAGLDLATVHASATGAGTVVAVLDTGVDPDHSFFEGRILPGYDMVDDDSDPDEVADGIDQDGDGHIDEAHGHGTFVAGVVLQIAPDAHILPVRVLDAEGNGDHYAVTAGIEYAVQQGADIINLSFGLDGELKSKRLEETVKWARKEGVIVVAAAGNSSADSKHFPAALKDVISVTALDESNDDVAWYANRGKWVTVAAPGHGIVSTTAGGGFARWTGTSMATPVVTGSYAVVAEQLAGEKDDKIIKAITKTAREMRRKDDVENGIIDIVQALVS